MTRVLVLYASTHGHTAKIAARVAKAIGPAAELRDIASGAGFGAECSGLVPVAAS